MLKNKTAVVYCADGLIGSVVASAFAREEATVILAGRALDGWEQLATEIADAGGTSHAAQVDARDEQAVDKYVNAVVERAGRIDVSFNAIAIADSIQGTPLIELSTEQVSQRVMHRVMPIF